MNRVSTGQTQTENKKTNRKLDIKDYNLKDANNEAMKQALANTDWDKILGDENNVEQANQIFATALIQAAEGLNVPKYNVDTKETKANIKLNRLEKSRWGKDKEDKQTRLANINQEIQSLLTNADKKRKRLLNLSKKTPKLSLNMQTKTKRPELKLVL